MDFLPYAVHGRAEGTNGDESCIDIVRVHGAAGGDPFVWP